MLRPFQNWVQVLWRNFINSFIWFHWLSWILTSVIIGILSFTQVFWKSKRSFALFSLHDIMLCNNGDGYNSVLFRVYINLFSLLSSARNDETGPESVLLLGSCIYCSSWWVEKNFCGEETSFGACCKELCVETTTICCWKIIQETGKEEEKRFKAGCLIIKKEDFVNRWKG